MRSPTPFTRTSNLLFLPHGTQENISSIGGNKTDDCVPQHTEQECGGLPLREQVS